jgi:allophanate hydrolase subunit 2
VAGHVEARALPPAFTWNHEPALLHILDGPQADWFPAEALANRPFTVTPASNRMGLRLRGVPLPVPARELTSEPVAPGAVQVTRDGQCIVLGVDGQTIGGYPKVAHVVSADVDKLAQLRPGETVRFARVSLDEAEALYRRKQAELREWLTRLATAQIFPPGEPPGSPRL